jgi:predicted RNase H-like HicB family nuclease
MSTDADDRPSGEPPSPVEITLTLGESGEVWVARDEETGVASQGPTREAALDNLDEAVAGYHGAGEPPSDEELRELGVDPDDNSSGALPDVLE